MRFLASETALCILEKQRKDYFEKGWSFSLRRFDGTRVTISESGIVGEDGKKIKLKCG